MEVDALVRYAAWSFDALMQINPVLGKARIVSLHHKSLCIITL